MQPKVSSALLKFVKPVASSEVSTNVSTKMDHQGSPSNQEQKQSQNEFKRETPPKVELSPPPPEPSKKLPTGVTNAFLYLFQKFNCQRETLTTWLVRGQYETASKQKSTGKIKKGSVLDRKSDEE